MKSARLAALTVSPDTTLYDALRAMDDGARGVVLVTENGLLVGLATDGDLRRAIIRGVPMNLPLREVMNTHPITAPVDIGREQAAEIMRRHRIQQLPLIDTQGRPADLLVLQDLVGPEPVPELAVIMAGGKGTRLWPLTRDMPKPMLEVGGRPVLEWIVEGLREQGFRRIVMCVHHYHEMIEEHFADGSRFGIPISYVVEDRPLGTAGALALMERPAGPFLVTNGDVLTSLSYARFFRHHTTSGAAISIALQGYEVQIPFGVIAMDGDAVVDIEEKPSYIFPVSAGIYILEPDVLDLIPEGQPFGMDALVMAALGRSLPVRGFLMKEWWLDIGRKDDLQHARQLGDAPPWRPSDDR